MKKHRIEKVIELIQNEDIRGGGHMVDTRHYQLYRNIACSFTCRMDVVVIVDEKES